MLASQLQDNFTQTWDTETIVEVVLPYILDNRITTVGQILVFITERALTGPLNSC